MFDILIKQAKVLDGTGNPGFTADLGVKQGKIIEIGMIDKQAETIIDAKGLCVAPGFIDPHAHDDGCAFFDEPVINKLSQGVTTDISGNCGQSLAPVSERYWRDNRKVHTLINPPECMDEFTSFDKFLKAIESRKLGINMGFLVGHAALRIAVMGLENREPTPAEMEQMKAYLLAALEEGALGMSAGLLYPPGSIAKQAEFIELCKVIKEKNAIFTIHIRDEGDYVIESVEEAIEIAKQSGAFVNISHHKAIGKKNWGKVKTTLRMIEEANQQGINVGFDQYPYNANCTYLSTILPPSYLVGDLTALIKNLQDKEFRKATKEAILACREKWDNFVVNVGFEGMLLIKADKTPDAVGKTVAEYARIIGQDPFDTALDLLVANELEAIAVYFSMSDDDVEEVMKNPYGMVGTDGIYMRNREKTHPRVAASFPRVLGHYVRERQVLRLEEAVRKMTSLPAMRLHLRNKGLIKEGFDADLVIFDADKIIDTADFIKDSYAPNVGVKYVVVGGKVALKDNVYTGAASGQVIRRQENR
ncbi:D-aminoacylase (Aspartate, glutamate ETC) [uncultured Sporomusa sp.]|uniref:D-aminoacylase (Aspartate, glutamate ETC) n=1 Tax=uncultured Sporomusa sp. TaxID=307249 RepID=A0A212LXC1_9FIRM|nr:D-aminoacylase [uncultured Sporomusa sp.]SCM82130.1 D-aminoacylase (Aspartate, glutamate ETC) [uncultured Sporomusa sp.]